MAFDLNDKIFISQTNTENGEVSSETIFHYHQNEELIWAEYSGGIIKKGSLIGKVLEPQEIEFNYQHISVNGELRAGYCKSTIVQKDGRIVLKENWQWFTGDQSKGYSELIEKVGEVK